MVPVTGKRVLVTGGGSGIGQAVARVFLQAGARVAITGRREARLRRAVEELGGGDRLLAQAADVSEPDQVAALVEYLNGKWGGVDILVNNAGANIKERTLRELNPQRWRLMLRSNLDGAFYCIHALLPQMLQRRDGTIVNVNSISGKRANPLGGAAYVAAKFGLGGLGICLAAEERENGIRVSNIYPGEVDTPILEARPQPVSEEQRQKILKPEDVAAAVFFVATLPPHVSVPELVIKPTTHVYI
jgi:NADP-dependent 3-hydroxy acid dehydrogenase YdfG